MNKGMKGFLKSVLRRCDIAVIRHETLLSLEESRSAISDLDFIRALPAEYAAPALAVLRESKSQLRQDLFVLSETGFKENGYFVEFGATNGVNLSNSYLLEKCFGWSGILAEPAKVWHDSLRRRRGVHVETRCVWSESGSILKFNEVENAELSTVHAFSDSDTRRRERNTGRVYDVETISLNDLLKKFNAPKVIDYLSIDTEGSEFSILKNFDFNSYRFNVITCEHNYTPAREEIYRLLSGNGYVRKFEQLSKFDDWYIKAG
ncbi:MULTISPECIES: FkbM family methyltransferase [unclassified Mesorhizobium]|uniref:FkbM family methyltransferase n=1 Tax=unclassified Mesorhizobium TaxID=325217 RepID=UPI000FE5DFF0|nr:MULTISPECIES: FkbM family methyltransferase [unclassified Mesorhizobium]RWC25137.1 MAG: FkbM family methyltransferase [Mesorhizobium sp.]TGT95216.1 FkbM family methyltransferase [Mesorhizobium sp. M5C.F.Ca.ET.164.01.1.1]TIS38250.1 MAG: FkbM family methyltransferase [Mesorhizobium sp.]TIU28073.1 MAG: FkbM family methyltransferase [Mesorhizobium sp.]